MNEATFPAEELRQRREALGLSKADVFQRIRIPIRYIDALERADFKELPGMGYTAGFLRTYCLFLELPAERFVDAYRSAAPRPRAGFHPFQQRAQRETRRRKENLLAWAAICGLLLLGWVTYAAVVRPESGRTDQRVDAGSRVTEIEAPRLTPNGFDY